MVKLLHNFNEGNLQVVPLDVPHAKVQKYLDKGWALAEGESYTPPKQKKKGRVLEVNLNLVPGAGDGEDTSTDTGVDTGKPLASDAFVGIQHTQADDRKIVQHAPDGSHRPGLSGKPKEILLGIAAAEGVEVDPELSKPAIKKAIEDARAAADGHEGDASDSADEDNSNSDEESEEDDESNDEDDDK